MNKKKKKDISLSIGDIVLVQTFAGPKVYEKITSLENEDKGWYESILVRQKDIDALREASIPYNNNVTPANVCTGTAFKFSIIKKIKGFKPEVERTIDESINSESKKNDRPRRKFRQPKEIIKRVKATK